MDQALSLLQTKSIICLIIETDDTRTNDVQINSSEGDGVLDVHWFQTEAENTLIFATQLVETNSLMMNLAMVVACSIS